MTLGERITQRLEELHMPQRELAARAGVTEISLSRYIHGERTPNVLVIVNVAKVLGVTADWLLGLEDLIDE